MGESERLSEADEYEFKKLKMSREIVDQVTKELKYKFWIVVFLGLVVAYFGISKYLEEAVKDQIDDQKTKAIVSFSCTQFWIPGVSCYANTVKRHVYTEWKRGRLHSDVGHWASIDLSCNMPA